MIGRFQDWLNFISFWRHFKDYVKEGTAYGERNIAKVSIMDELEAIKLIIKL